MAGTSCGRCGKSFLRKGAASPYCSKACSSYHKRKGFISPAARHAIYERDDWTCQLCFEPVDPSAHYLDDWAASLDHIEPRALAVVPDHTPQNLRLAHRWCNSVRGDGSYYTEEVLRAA